MNCSTSKSDDNSKKTALAGLVLLNSCTPTSTLPTQDLTSCTTIHGTGIPDWIKNSFSCVTTSVSGNNYVFNTTSIPTYNSVYWGSSSSKYESAQYKNCTGSNYTNPNTIKSQNNTLTVPKDNTSTSSASFGMGVIGIATNGIVIYNDQAAPGDSLSTEYYTFDTSQGHPTNTGSYHYHVEPPQISKSDSKLVGIAQDGYLIFGKYHDSTAATLSSFTLGGTSSSTKCNTSGVSSSVPSTWTYASNYTSSSKVTANTSYHYHVNNGTEVNAIILSGKSIGALGTSQ